MLLSDTGRDRFLRINHFHDFLRINHFYGGQSLQSFPYHQLSHSVIVLCWSNLSKQFQIPGNEKMNWGRFRDIEGGNLVNSSVNKGSALRSNWLRREALAWKEDLLAGTLWQVNHVANLTAFSAALMREVADAIGELTAFTRETAKPVLTQILKLHTMARAPSQPTTGATYTANLSWEKRKIMHSPNICIFSILKVKVLWTVRKCSMWRCFKHLRSPWRKKSLKQSSSTTARRTSRWTLKQSSYNQQCPE